MSNENQEGAFKPINIREVFYEKNPKLARLLPGFVYHFIHRVMQIDFLNGFIIKYGHLSGMEFVSASLKDFEIEETILGGENIPEAGRYIFAGNHPLGGFDSLLLMEIVHHRLGSFKFLVNDVLMNIPPLRPLFVPVNKHGAYARESARLLRDTYLSDDQILIFPSGYASRKIKGRVTDLPWQKHFIAKSIEFRRDVIPVFISGCNSDRFYWLARWRTRLGIKWNLEMFLLPDETYRHRKKHITIHFGKPIPWSTFTSDKPQRYWADYVRERVYLLPEGTGN